MEDHLPPSSRTPYSIKHIDIKAVSWEGQSRETDYTFQRTWTVKVGTAPAGGATGAAPGFSLPPPASDL